MDHTGAVSYLIEGFGISGAEFCIYTATEKVNFSACIFGTERWVCVSAHMPEPAKA
jgi:hypothetical protein